jgi:DNA-binding SARP family transcriptional activator
MTLRVDVWDVRSAAVAILDADDADTRSMRTAGRRLLESWGGPLISDDSFGDWIEPSRWHLHQQVLRACLKAAAASLSGGDLRQVERLSALATTLDPWSDRAYELLARAQLAGGDRDAARRTVERLTVVLEQIGVHPGPALHALARRSGLALRRGLQGPSRQSDVGRSDVSPPRTAAAS